MEDEDICMLRTVARNVLVLTIALLLLIPLATLAQGGKAGGDLSLSFQPDVRTVVGNPISIDVGSNASIQVYYEGYEHGQVFGDADSGIFFWVEDDVYGSNLEVTNGVSAYNQPTLSFEVLDHTGPVGNGSDGNPWVITTRVKVGDTGLEATQKAAYVNGRDVFKLEWTIENVYSTQVEFDFFHAADFFVAGRDEGYGYRDPESGAVGGYNESRDWVMAFVPRVAPTHYQASEYRDIWNAIGYCNEEGCSQGSGFDDSIRREYVDNGAGLQWHMTLAGDEMVQISEDWRFISETATPEPTSTGTETVVPTNTPQPKDTLTPTPIPSATATMEPSVSPSPTPTLTPTPVPPEEIPEPGTLVLLASGLSALGAYAGLRKRRKDG
jgi:hypothetical protein